VSSDTIRQAQQQLADKGHDPGPIDGVLGPQTREAAKSFQQAQGIDASGELDAKTLSALGVSSN
jgi:peptidoglycan hydrolase-like protein with peptidoglycan-binding domain